MEKEIKRILNENIDHDKLNELDFEQMERLSYEIREFLIEKVSKTGGHLASNLGVVELTVMLHRCFDFKKDDRIIFDVGHQSYVHKILTGRMEGFDTLRETGGISGFPLREESETDCFDTGHSGTAISLADGIASAKKLKNEEGFAIAVVGDGALTGGLCYEALNNIGNTDKKVIIILNDNGMSISKNVGALSKMLTKMRASKGYFKAKSDVKSVLDKIPLIGKSTAKMLKKVRNRLKKIISPNILEESFGIKYYGPIDGHDLKKLQFFMESAKKAERPIILHIKTVKGKGYNYAEEQPSRFHGVSSFEVDKGTTHSIKNDYSEAAGMELCFLASKNKDVVAVCPAMTQGCGLSGFAEFFPDRFFDCAIAEEHGVTFAAGLAKEGMIPVVFTYSTFFQRAYDQIWHDVAMNNFHVVFCIDRAGFPGSDGKTHQGIYDLSYFGNIPKMAMLSPSSFQALSSMLGYAIEEHKGPIAIRYPKGKDSECEFFGFEFGKANVAKKGEHITLCAEGMMLKTALEAAKIAESEGVYAEVIELGTVYPLDIDTIEKSFKKTGKILTLEGNIKRGGMGELIFSHFKCEGKILAFPDGFIEHGKTEDLMKMYGLDKDSVAKEIICLAGGNYEA